MDSDLALALLMRWMHIFCAVFLAGSILFYAVVLAPIMRKVLTPEQLEVMRGPLLRRWKLLIHPSIVLFLISGFYNYIVVTGPKHHGQPVYHMLFGIKFLLSLVVFALAIVVTSNRKWSEKWRQNKGAWILLVVTVIAVVLVGGYMKVLPPPVANP